MSTVSPERPHLQLAVAIVSALGLGVGGLFFGFVLLSLTVVLIGALTGASLSNFEFLVLSLVFVQGIGCAGVALAYYKLRPVVSPSIRSLLDLSGESQPFGIPASVPGLRDTVVIVGGYVAAFVGVFLGSALITLVQTATGSNLDTGTNQAAEIGMENPEALLVLIPASILVIGPGEELLFRGVVQGRLREFLGPVPGILLASVVFAAPHWFALSGGSPTGNLAALSILAAVAVVVGTAYEYTENIVVPSLIHGFYNATLFGMLYLVVAYGDQLPQQGLLV